MSIEFSQLSPDGEQQLGINQGSSEGGQQMGINHVHTQWRTTNGNQLTTTKLILLGICSHKK
jgi:hypothetical protein